MKDKLINLLKDNKMEDNYIICVSDNGENNIDMVADIYIDGYNNLVLFTGENNILYSIYNVYYVGDLKEISLKNIKSIYVDCNEYVPVKEIKVYNKKVVFYI